MGTVGRTPRDQASERGFTLVELMMVVAIIGVLAALAIYGVTKYLAAAKSAEAKANVGGIARQAATEYQREHTPAQILKGGNSSLTDTHVLCGAATPVPASITQVQGRKYQPGKAPGLDFGIGDMSTGWPCLGFAITDSIYYRYRYEVGTNYVSQGLPGAPQIPATGFEASAQGDVDSDGTLSTFARSGDVQNGSVVVATQVYVDQEYE